MLIDEKVALAVAKRDKKDLGQYFTIEPMLQDFVFNCVRHKGSLLLEPSFGAGHLLKKFKEADPNYPMLCYELDTTITPTITFNIHQNVVYGDFTQQRITQRFKTIIGNPPYVKQSIGNLYIKFIELCYNLLADDGELIFIVPSDFIKVTSAAKLIQTMTANGSFTDFLFPNNEKLFEGASIDVLVFRYEKGLLQNKTCVNGKQMLCTISNGIITFNETEVKGTPIGDLFNVYVGLVSGRDEIYRVPFGNVSLLADKDKKERFIFPTSYPTNDPVIDTHLLLHKPELLTRKIKKFTEKNWFEWGAPRNITAIQASSGQSCIYVKNITRSKEVAFQDTVQFFGGSLLCLVPKQASTDLKKVLAHLNSETFQKDYLYAGRFKIGHKQVCNIILP